MSDGSDFEPSGGEESDFEPSDVELVPEDDDDFVVEEPPVKRQKTKAKGKGKGKGKASPPAAAAAAAAAAAKGGKGPKEKNSPARKGRGKVAKGKAGGGGGAGGGAGAGASSKKGAENKAPAKKKAAGGKKGKAATGSVKEKDAPAVLLKYLTEQNRPLSAVNIFENLHKVVKRAHVNRCLDKLAASGQIRMKQYKKFKLYFPDQAQYGDITTEQVDAMTAESKAKQQELAGLVATKSSLTSQAARLRNEPTDSELEEQLAAALAVAEEKKARLQAIKDSGNTVSPDARKNLVDTFKKYRTAWKKRRDMVMTVADQMAEGMGKKPKQIAEMVGFDTDEEAGVSLKTCKL